jgi:hypothetical protein
MKDYLEPRPIVAASCAAQGYKKLDANGDGQLTGAEKRPSNGVNNFKVYVDYNGDGDHATPTSRSTSRRRPGGNPGYYLIDDVNNGTYDVREELSPAQAAAGWTCTVPATCKATVVFDGGLKNGPTFGNFRPGKLEIVKAVVRHRRGDDTFNLSSARTSRRPNASSGQGTGEMTVAPGHVHRLRGGGHRPGGHEPRRLHVGDRVQGRQRHGRGRQGGQRHVASPCPVTRATTWSARSPTRATPASSRSSRRSSATPATTRSTSGSTVSRRRPTPSTTTAPAS